MNRLVIVGNGFDLAHNLKTKYSDFIFSYLKQCFLDSESKGVYEDNFIKLQSWYKNSHNVIAFEIDDVRTINDFKRFLEKPAVGSGIYFLGDSNRDFNQYYNTEKRERFLLTIKDEFFRHLYKNACDLTWVDIEREYYELLKKTLSLKDDEKNNKIKALNHSFKFLKSRFKEYITSVSLEYECNDNIVEIINCPINFKNIPTIKEKELEEIRGNYKQYMFAGGWEIAPVKTMFLNFNYTNSISKYCESGRLKNSEFTVTNIHGTSKENIIFGYGDEMDDSYKQLEHENNNEYLRFAKSFGYFNDTNYHNLIRFLDTDRYELLIFGHSCGLSDRTLLNMIFEHDNCKSIKVSYHKRQDGSNDFSEKTMEISRHFKNKQKMRERVLPFDKCSPLSQLISAK